VCSQRKYWRNQQYDAFWVAGPLAPVVTFDQVTVTPVSVADPVQQRQYLRLMNALPFRPMRGTEAVSDSRSIFTHPAPLFGFGGDSG